MFKRSLHLRFHGRSKVPRISFRPGKISTGTQYANGTGWHFGQTRVTNKIFSVEIRQIPQTRIAIAGVTIRKLLSGGLLALTPLRHSIRVLRYVDGGGGEQD